MKNTNVFHIMTKPTGPLCNLDCTYCFYLEKEKIYPGTSDWLMKDQILEQYIKHYIETQTVDEITFSWQGGEPSLLGLKFFEKVVNLQKKYCEDKIIHNTFQTNATILDNKWCEFFAKNNFLLGISIDGPEEIHNKYRVFKGGKPTFTRVLESIDLLKSHGVEFNTLSCVTIGNSYEPVKIYNFLKEIGSGFMQFIPIVERRLVNQEKGKLNLVSPDSGHKAKVTEWSVEPLQFGKFLSCIFDEWVRKDVGKYFVQMFDLALEGWYGYNPGLCVFNEMCGKNLAMEHNGDLYSCDHYVYPENKIGNIWTDNLETVVNSGKQMKFGLDKKMKLTKYCRKCEYLFICNGDCPKHRIINSPDGEAGLSYLCEGYKLFFKHIDPYMQFMVNELENNRPPANVMQWIKNQERKF